MDEIGRSLPEDEQRVVNAFLDRVTETISTPDYPGS
jgi:hypothetical protein